MDASPKQELIDVIRGLPEMASAAEILAALHARVADDGSPLVQEYAECGDDLEARLSFWIDQLGVSRSRVDRLIEMAARKSLGDVPETPMSAELIRDGDSGPDQSQLQQIVVRVGHKLDLSTSCGKVLWERASEAGEKLGPQCFAPAEEYSSDPDDDLAIRHLMISGYWVEGLCHELVDYFAFDLERVRKRLARFVVEDNDEDCLQRMHRGGMETLWAFADFLARSRD